MIEFKRKHVMNIILIMWVPLLERERYQTTEIDLTIWKSMDLKGAGTKVPIGREASLIRWLKTNGN